MPKLDRTIIERKLSDMDRALERLGEALVAPLDPQLFLLDASLHRFMFCYELLWKNIRRFLDMRDVHVNSPVMTFRGAFQEGWIADKETFEQMIEDRNLVTHEYFETEAREAYKRLPAYLQAMRLVADHLHTLLHSGQLTL